MQNFEKYRVTDGKTRLDAAFFNPVHQDIDLRLHAVETLKMSWESAVDDLTRFGLRRIDGVLAPTLHGIQELAELGFLTAPVSTVAVSFTTGPQSIVVDAGPRRASFYASPFVAMTTESDWQKYAIARVLGYDRETGVLDLHVLSVNGGDEGPFQPVQIANVAATVPATETLMGQAQVAAQDAAAAKTDATDARDQAELAARTATDAAAALNAAQAGALATSNIINDSAISGDTLNDVLHRIKLQSLLGMRLL